MAEKRVVYKEHSTSELARLLGEFDFLAEGEALQEHTLLFGGFSGSNYKVVGTEPAARVDCEFAAPHAAVLKICNGYTTAFVESLAAVMQHLWKSGFRGMCPAVPLKSGAGYSTLCAEGTPTLLLGFLPGRAADAVIRDGKVDPLVVMRGVGEGLGAMSAVAVAKADGLRHCRDGGACAVGDHMRGAELELLTTDARSKDHPFRAFYEAQYPNLVAGMGADDLPEGVRLCLCVGCVRW